MTEREHSVRFTLNGDASDEAEVLSRALQGAASSRRGTDLLRFVVMRGWMDIIHNTSPRERVILLRSLGISQSLIQEIELHWPKPMLYQAQDEGALQLQNAGINAAMAVANQAASLVRKGAGAQAKALQETVVAAPAAPAATVEPVAEAVAQQPVVASTEKPLQEGSSELVTVKPAGTSPRRSRLGSAASALM